MDIVHDTEAHRFSVEVDGHAGTVDYVLHDGVMTITHTRVAPEIGNRGIAAALTRAALLAARREGWRVVPACSYAVAFMRKYPEFADLLA
jgi:predicted GNAT family acetyltransferase